MNEFVPVGPVIPYPSVWGWLAIGTGVAALAALLFVMITERRKK